MSSTSFLFRHALALTLAAFSLCFFLPSAARAGQDPPDLLLSRPAEGESAPGAPDAQARSPVFQSADTPVRFDTQAALALPIGAEARIALPRLGTLAVVHDRRETHPNGDVTWAGYFKGWGDNYRVVLTAGANGVAGRLVSPDGEFSLLQGGGGAWLRDHRQAGLRPAAMEADDTVAAPPAPAPSNVPRVADMAAMAPATDPTAQTTIDLMIVYTQGMAQTYGDSLQTRLNNLVAIANQAYIDSGVHITLRLVHAVQVNYDETADLGTALDDITYGNGAFARVEDLRKQYGADLVHLIIKPTHVFCGGGKGWLNTAPQIPAYGFSTSYDHGDVAGCNNNDVIMAHELGHNMGVDHDRAHSAGYDLGYAYGYGIEGKFADVMSASYINAPVVAKFSNPSLTCGPDNDPCGIAPGLPGAADAAQALNDNREAVAALMLAQTQPTATLTATPASVAQGGSSTLAWSSTHATACSGSWAGAASLAGSATVSPTGTTVYTLTCTGSGGSATATATVSVAGMPPAPTATLTATPASVARGGSSTLAWSSTHATACSATASDGWSGPVSLAGSAAVSPAATMTYTLTCVGPGGVATATASVGVGAGTQTGCLFDWAEKTYPDALPKSGGWASGVWGVYTYRHYPAIDAYVGVSSADNHVYYRGPDGVLQDEGPLSKWLPLAGCQ